MDEERFLRVQAINKLWNQTVPCYLCKHTLTITGDEYNAYCSYYGLYKEVMITRQCPNYIRVVLYQGNDYD
jgi:hypothetical protein